jgi:hypothetical protein
VHKQIHEKKKIESAKSRFFSTLQAKKSAIAKAAFPIAPQA